MAWDAACQHGPAGRPLTGSGSSPTGHSHSLLRRLTQLTRTRGGKSARASVIQAKNRLFNSAARLSQAASPGSGSGSDSDPGVPASATAAGIIAPVRSRDTNIPAFCSDSSPVSVPVFSAALASVQASRASTTASSNQTFFTATLAPDEPSSSSPDSTPSPHATLTIQVEICFADPEAVNRPPIYTETYETSPDFVPSEWLRRGLLRRLNHCCQELITRPDAEALRPKQPYKQEKPLRYELRFRLPGRNYESAVDKVFSSYQKEQLTPDDAREIILSTHRMIGLFLRRHDRDFRWSEYPTGEAPDPTLASPASASLDALELVRPLAPGQTLPLPQSLSCVARSHFVDESQTFEFIPGYSIRLVFHSKSRSRGRSHDGGRGWDRGGQFQTGNPGEDVSNQYDWRRVVRLQSTQTAPLYLALAEELLWNAFESVNTALAQRRAAYLGAHAALETRWPDDLVDGESLTSHENDKEDLLAIDLVIANNFGPNYDHLSRTIRTRLALFDQPNARDCEQFLSSVSDALLRGRDMTDAHINALPDLDFRILSLHGPGWSVGNSPVRFVLGPDTSYSRRSIKAILDRLQSGFVDELYGDEVSLRMAAHKRGHLIFHETLHVHAPPSRMPVLPKTKLQIDSLVSRLQDRGQKDIDFLCKDTCSLDNLPESPSTSDEEDFMEEPPCRPLAPRVVELPPDVTLEIAEEQEQEQQLPQLSQPPQPQLRSAMRPRSRRAFPLIPELFTIPPSPSAKSAASESASAVLDVVAADSAAELGRESSPKLVRFVEPTLVAEPRAQESEPETEQELALEPEREPEREPESEAEHEPVLHELVETETATGPARTALPEAIPEAPMEMQAPMESQAAAIERELQMNKTEEAPVQAQMAISKADELARPLSLAESAISTISDGSFAASYASDASRPSTPSLSSGTDISPRDSLVESPKITDSDTPILAVSAAAVAAAAVAVTAAAAAIATTVVDAAAVSSNAATAKVVGLKPSALQVLAPVCLENEGIAPEPVPPNVLPSQAREDTVVEAIVPAVAEKKAEAVSATEKSLACEPQEPEREARNAAEAEAGDKAATEDGSNDLDESGLELQDLDMAQQVLDATTPIDISTDGATVGLEVEHLSGLDTKVGADEDDVEARAEVAIEEAEVEATEEKSEVNAEEEEDEAGPELELESAAFEEAGYSEALSGPVTVEADVETDPVARPFSVGAEEEAEFEYFPVEAKAEVELESGTAEEAVPKTETAPEAKLSTEGEVEPCEAAAEDHAVDDNSVQTLEGMEKEDPTEVETVRSVTPAEVEAELEADIDTATEDGLEQRDWSVDEDEVDAPVKGSVPTTAGPVNSASFASLNTDLGVLHYVEEFSRTRLTIDMDDAESVCQEEDHDWTVPSDDDAVAADASLAVVDADNLVAAQPGPVTAEAITIGVEAEADNALVLDEWSVLEPIPEATVPTTDESLVDNPEEVQRQPELDEEQDDMQVNEQRSELEPELESYMECESSQQLPTLTAAAFDPMGEEPGLEEILGQDPAAEKPSQVQDDDDLAHVAFPELTTEETVLEETVSGVPEPAGAMVEEDGTLQKTATDVEMEPAWEALRLCQSRHSSVEEFAEVCQESPEERPREFVPEPFVALEAVEAPPSVTNLEPEETALEELERIEPAELQAELLADSVQEAATEPAVESVLQRAVEGTPTHGLLKELVFDEPIVEVPEPAGSVKSVESMEPAETVDPVEIVDLVEPVDPVEAVDPVEPVDPVETVDLVEPVDPVEAVDPVEPVDPVEAVDPVEIVDLVEPVDPVETVGPMGTDKPAMFDKTIEPVDPVTGDESAEPAEPVELVQQVEPIEPIGESVCLESASKESELATAADIETGLVEWAAGPASEESVVSGPQPDQERESDETAVDEVDSQPQATPQSTLTPAVAEVWIDDPLSLSVADDGTPEPEPETISTPLRTEMESSVEQSKDVSDAETAEVNTAQAEAEEPCEQMSADKEAWTATPARPTTPTSKMSSVTWLPLAKTMSGDSSWVDCEGENGDSGDGGRASMDSVVTIGSLDDDDDDDSVQALGVPMPASVSASEWLMPRPLSMSTAGYLGLHENKRVEVGLRGALTGSHAFDNVTPRASPRVSRPWLSSPGWALEAPQMSLPRSVSPPPSSSPSSSRSRPRQGYLGSPKKTTLAPQLGGGKLLQRRGRSVSSRAARMVSKPSKHDPAASDTVADTTDMTGAAAVAAEATSTATVKAAELPLPAANRDDVLKRIVVMFASVVVVSQMIQRSS